MIDTLKSYLFRMVKNIEHYSIVIKKQSFMLRFLVKISIESFLAAVKRLLN